MGSRRLTRSLRRTTVLALMAIAALATIGSAAADPILPTPITDQAEDIEGLFWLVTWVAIAVFVLVIAALLIALFRFRRRDPDELPTQTHGSTPVEMAWIGIPVVIVLVLFGASFVVLDDISADAEEDDLTIQVRGFQFSWEFRYDPSDLGTTQPIPEDSDEIQIIGTGLNQPTLVVPVDEPVEFVLNSQDVIHSFYVRDFLFKLDVIPGHENNFVVVPREIGSYDAQCAELCGVDHALMLFTLEVVSREDFDAWLMEQAGGDAEENGEDEENEDAVAAR